MAHGATLTDAVANAQQAIDGWLEVARETERPNPKPLAEIGACVSE